VVAEVHDVRAAPLDNGGGDEERGEFPQHDSGEINDRPPAPREGEEDDAGRPDQFSERQACPGGQIALIEAGVHVLNLR
jgi:hypothetical protein